MLGINDLGVVFGKFLLMFSPSFGTDSITDVAVIGPCFDKVKVVVALTVSLLVIYYKEKIRI